MQKRFGLDSLAYLVSTHRILASRIFGGGFFVMVLITESQHEGSLISTTLFVLGLVLVGIATVGRLWCSLYISGYKNAELINTGPYSMVRNPLYFFSLVGFTGIGLATETVTFAVALLLLALMFYPAVIRREESLLRMKFGTAFDEYLRTTPRLLPDPALFKEPETYTVNPRLFRRTMGDVIWFVWFVGIVEIVEALHEYHYVRPLFALP